MRGNHFACRSPLAEWGQRQYFILTFSPTQHLYDLTFWVLCVQSAGAPSNYCLCVWMTERANSDSLPHDWSFMVFLVPFMFRESVCLPKMGRGLLWLPSGFWVCSQGLSLRRVHAGSLLDLQGTPRRGSLRFCLPLFASMSFQSKG